VPSLAIAACLVAGAAERVPALRLSLRGWR
jgi:hypothetical protein